MSQAALDVPLAPLVLLVDDSDTNRMVCVECLEGDGFRVAEAVDGLDALDKVAGALPDVIVLDVSMPDMDGWEVIRRLRADPSAKGIPIILLSGGSLDPKAVDESGCAAYLTKPFHLKDLIDAVRGVLATRRR